MKEQPKPNWIRTLVAVAGFALVGICARDAINLGGRACAYVGKQFQPVADVATNVFTDLSKDRPNTIYNLATNEVRIIQGMLANGPNVMAQRRAWDVYMNTFNNSLRKNLVDSPMPQDRKFLDAIDYIGRVAGIKE